jgi:hypothetical protein
MAFSTTASVIHSSQHLTAQLPRFRYPHWLKTINIPGRQYLTQEAIEEFHRRDRNGEFSQVNKVPTRMEAGVGG